MYDIALTVAYIGPEFLLPFASILATLAGIVLMFWHKTKELAGKLWRATLGRLFGTRKT